MFCASKEYGMKAIKTEKLVFPGLHIVSLQRSFGTEYFITATPKPDQSPWKMHEQIFNYIKTKNATIISQDVFGPLDSHSREIIDKHLEQLSTVNWPITWIENRGNSDLSGTYIWAISGIDVTPIYLQNHVIGNVVEHELVRFIRLGGLTAKGRRKTPQQQTREVLEQIETALQTAKMDFSNVIRTWFYNRNISSWYREFNLVRNKFFQERNVFNRLVPASTAVGKCNGADIAVVGGALAVESKGEDIRVFALPSPLQGPALEYGSSFSRAIELALPDHRRLYVSGTASIEPNGKTIYMNDTPSQVRCTMEVTYSILKSREMDWSDITRATAYFKNAKEAVLLSEYCQTNGLPRFPIIIAENDICRDDLLFEIEVDAIK
jgi:enamine deaminase RidA (YjgF/YER057c/UK114 family)